MNDDFDAIARMVGYSHEPAWREAVRTEAPPVPYRTPRRMPRQMRPEHRPRNDMPMTDAAQAWGRAGGRAEQQMRFDDENARFNWIYGTPQQKLGAVPGLLASTAQQAGDLLGPGMARHAVHAFADNRPAEGAIDTAFALAPLFGRRALPRPVGRVSFAEAPARAAVTPAPAPEPMRPRAAAQTPRRPDAGSAVAVHNAVPDGGMAERGPMRLYRGITQGNERGPYWTQDRAYASRHAMGQGEEGAAVIQGEAQFRNPYRVTSKRESAMVEVPEVGGGQAWIDSLRAKGHDAIIDDIGNQVYVLDDSAIRSSPSTPAVGAREGGQNLAPREMLDWLRSPDGRQELIRNPTQDDLAFLTRENLGNELKYVRDTQGNYYVFSAADAHHNGAMRALREHGVEVMPLGPGAEITNKDAAGFIFREPDGSFVHADADAHDTGSWADFVRRTGSTSRGPSASHEPLASSAGGVPIPNVVRRPIQAPPVGETRPPLVPKPQRPLPPSEPHGARGNERFHDPRLSPQQNKAVEMERNGYTRAEIADELDISPQQLTVVFANTRTRGVEVVRKRGGRLTDARGYTASDLFAMRERGLTVSQIAARTGISANSVAVRLSLERARRGVPRQHYADRSAQIARWDQLHRSGQSYAEIAQAEGGGVTRKAVIGAIYRYRARQTPQANAFTGIPMPPAVVMCDFRRALADLRELKGPTDETSVRRQVLVNRESLRQRVPVDAPYPVP